MAGMSVKRVFWYNNTSAVLRIYMPGTVVHIENTHIVIKLNVISSPVLTTPDFLVPIALVSASLAFPVAPISPLPT
jgi:hypothetical protein